MQTLPTFLTALLPLLGVVIGAGLQYYFSKAGERLKQLEGLRNQAYVDYLRSVAQSAHLRNAGDQQKQRELLVALTDAKARICIYGSASVIKALAAIQQGDLNLNSPDSIGKFLSLCNEMRQQSQGKAEAVAINDLKWILFGREE